MILVPCEPYAAGPLSYVAASMSTTVATNAAAHAAFTDQVPIPAP